MPTPPAQEQAASRKGFHLKQRRAIDRCKTLTSPSVTMLETDGRWGQNRLPRWGHCGLPLPPNAWKRKRHFETVTGVVPRRRAISRVGTPSPASKTI